MLITTAPYGNTNINGEIYEIVSDRTVNEDGDEVGEQQIQGVTLIDVKEYNPSSFMWEDGTNTNINILNTSIILKNNGILKASDLKKGDRVRVLKTEDNEDGYIIFVE